MSSSRDDKPWVREWLRKVPEIMESSRQKCREAMESHIISYLGESTETLMQDKSRMRSLLSHPDPDIRSYTIDFLTFFLSEADEYLDIMRNIAWRDPASEVREHAITFLTFSCIDNYNHDTMALLASVCINKEEREGIRASAYCT